MRPRHVYVHVPFCARRCSYCDFSIAVRPATPVDEYLGALRRELELRYPRASHVWNVDTLYFGGGTPSRLGSEGVARTMELMQEWISVASDAEVTLEANPEDVTPASARAWKDAGINRLSIGVQSFDDAVLQWMHRVHDAETAVRAVHVAQDSGIADLSIDLIFALPEMLRRGWTADLERALALRPSHISLYGLTVEPHTPLARWRDRGEVAESPEERYEDEYLHAHDALVRAGFDHYEVSNFGRPGHHARHNGAYWRGVAYAGLGPSAHEFDGTRRRRWNVAPYAEWVRRLTAGEDAEADHEILSDDNRIAELVYLGLRTSEGVELRPGEHTLVDPWISAGWACVGSNGRLALTATGWLRLDTLARDLTSLRSH